jgi:hypothetical protein
MAKFGYIFFLMGIHKIDKTNTWLVQKKLYFNGKYKIFFILFEGNY